MLEDIKQLIDKGEAPKDILVTYKGGGYDGCFWEWNFFIFDSEGNFIDIGSSGYKAITELKDALELLSNEENFIGSRQEAFITNLNDSDSIKEFVKETNEGNVLNVIQRVNKHYADGDLCADPKMTFQCPYCERLVSEGQNTGYKGAGGIAIAFTGLICNDCYCEHTCGYCGEFHEETSEIMVDDSDHCTYCKPEVPEAEAITTEVKG